MQQGLTDSSQIYLAIRSIWHLQINSQNPTGAVPGLSRAVGGELVCSGLVKTDSPVSVPARGREGQRESDEPTSDLWWQGLSLIFSTCERSSEALSSC